MSLKFWQFMIFTKPNDEWLSFTFVESTPASDVSGVSDIILVVVRQADWQQVRLERLKRLVESQKCEIVLERAGIELRMCGDDLHSAFLKSVGFVLVGEIVLAEPQQQIARWNAAIGRKVIALFINVHYNIPLYFLYFYLIIEYKASRYLRVTSVR